MKIINHSNCEDLLQLHYPNCTDILAIPEPLPPAVNAKSLYHKEVNNDALSILNIQSISDARAINVANSKGERKPPAFKSKVSHLTRNGICGQLKFAETAKSCKNRYITRRHTVADFRLGKKMIQFNVS